MKIGYARVSTKDQNLNIQTTALKKADCEKIFTDKISGMKKERPGLTNALNHLRSGDTFVVWKLDRLGRSVKNLISFVENLERDKINFISITDAIDTTTPSGRFFFHMMASLAQMERELIAERTKAGLKAARKQGRIGGRPKKMTETKLEAAKQLLSSGTLPKDVAKNLGISVATLYRWLPANSN
jgi:DNA invertase Pin-like site-specific DNA recombinase